jgi:hypothetical protein
MTETGKSQNLASVMPSVSSVFSVRMRPVAVILPEDAEMKNSISGLLRAMRATQ